MSFGVFKVVPFASLRESVVDQVAILCSHRYTGQRGKCYAETLTFVGHELSSVHRRRYRSALDLNPILLA